LMDATSHKKRAAGMTNIPCWHDNHVIPAARSGREVVSSYHD
jgi:hypothetical protein